MKFVINRYSLNYHIVQNDPLPISDINIEKLLFGDPPFEYRKIWTIHIKSLEEIIDLVDFLGILAQVSVSPFWSGDVDTPGDRLFGLAMIDDTNHIIDPRDRPKWIRRQYKTGDRQ